MPARLTFYLPQRPARVHDLRDGEDYVVGRDADCPLQVDDDRVSRRHALLRSREMLVRSRVMPDNHLRGILKAFGLKVGKVDAGRLEYRVHELVQRPHPGTRSLGADTPDRPS